MRLRRAHHQLRQRSGVTRRRLVRLLITDEDLLDRYLVYGDRSRLHVHPTARINNAVFNLIGGDVYVDRDAFFGHHVSVLTGSHDYTQIGLKRQTTGPTIGQDVTIGEGAWVATNVTIVGPCRIGVHAVVGACSLVLEDVPPYTMVAGVPARVIRVLKSPS